MEISYPSAPPGHTGSSRLKSFPPMVIASMKHENTRPVGSASLLTVRSVGTHMNTKLNMAPSKNAWRSHYFSWEFSLLG